MSRAKRQIDRERVGSLGPAEQRLGGRSHRVRGGDPFGARLDLLLTSLALIGIALAVMGGVLIGAREGLSLGLLELPPDGAGLALLVHGLLLWRAAEGARSHRLFPRVLLLVLAAFAAPTIVALPLVLWTGATLLPPRMRAYCDARLRGRDPREAALLAQGHPVPLQEIPAAVARRRAAALANGRAAVLLAALGGTAAVAWAIARFDAPGPVLAPAWSTVLAAALAIGAACAVFALLRRAVARGRALKWNAVLWTILAPIAPGTARRARMVARDRRDLASTRQTNQPQGEQS